MPKFLEQQRDTQENTTSAAAAAADTGTAEAACFCRFRVVKKMGVLLRNAVWCGRTKKVCRIISYEYPYSACCAQQQLLLRAACPTKTQAVRGFAVRCCIIVRQSGFGASGVSCRCNARCGSLTRTHSTQQRQQQQHIAYQADHRPPMGVLSYYPRTFGTNSILKNVVPHGETSVLFFAQTTTGQCSKAQKLPIML